MDMSIGIIGIFTTTPKLTPVLQVDLLSTNATGHYRVAPVLNTMN